ncbi:peptidase S8 [Chlorella sorokiniana]|uniref:Peptidase S8 n=1 Tax=Chlorella sorokiniana TaxID=3076 RepID=A0A2P6TKI9_CHLSO|nr:peptidase S8 [Chlorella sorokiniana]|eukprot:PRW44586.1 peptidase S8 [Chlorella sorokiniana]
MLRGGRWAVLALLLGLAAATRELKQGNGRPKDVDQDDPPRWKEHPRVEREALVRFAPGATPAAKGRALIQGQAQEAEVVASDASGQWVRVKFSGAAGASTAKAAKKVEEDAAVEAVEPNFIYTRQLASNDPAFTSGSLWGMYGDSSSPANAFGSRAAEAWAAGFVGRDDIYIGIIDEGYMHTHEDLIANRGTNPGEIPGNGRDDDSNGYVDDVYGWDFVSNDNSVFDSTGDDHGTHVAGTMGATGGNGKGVAGVNWRVKLLSGKLLGSSGGTTANAIKAVDYFTDLKTRHGIKLVATSNSWGGGGYSQALKDAIDRAAAANILFIAAAGNGGSDGIGDNIDATPSYPASYASNNVIAVASITNTGALSSFSNFGATSVDIGAPGSGIRSTVPSSYKQRGVTYYSSAYADYSGTSMATPHVSGAAALYAAWYLNTTGTMPSAAAIKAAILASAEPTASLSGRCVSNGRLNVARLLGLEP